MNSVGELIATYFPPNQRANAACVLDAEGEEGFSFDAARWSPAAAGDNTPFTVAEWESQAAPENNVWMASVVWSIGGWRAWPSSCQACAICQVTGEPIPHPRNPVAFGTPARGLVAASSPLAGVLGSVAVLAGLGGLALIEAQGRVF